MKKNTRSSLIAGVILFAFTSLTHSACAQSYSGSGYEMYSIDTFDSVSNQLLSSVTGTNVPSEFSVNVTSDAPYFFATMTFGGASVMGLLQPDSSLGAATDFGGFMTDWAYPVGFSNANFDVFGAYAVADIYSDFYIDNTLEYQLSFTSFQTDPFSVPEPSSLVLAISAATVAMMLALYRRFFSNRATRVAARVSR